MFLLFLIFYSCFFTQEPQSLCPDILKKNEALINTIQKTLNSKNSFYKAFLVKKFKHQFPQIIKLHESNCINNDIKLKTYIEFLIAVFHYSVTEKYGQSSKYFYQVYQHKELLNNEQLMVLYAALGDNEKINGNNIKSIFFYNKQLQIAIQSHNRLEQYRALRELGVNNRDLGNYNIAKKYLYDASVIEKEIKINNDEKVWMLIHLGCLYRMKKQYKIAQYYYNNSLKLTDIPSLYYLKTTVLQEYCQLWEQQKKYDSLKKYSNEILSVTNRQIKSQIRLDLYPMSGSLYYIGYSYLLQKDTLRAIENFENSFILGKQLNTTEYTKKSAKFLARITDKKSKIHKDALNYIIESYKEKEETLKFIQEDVQNLREIKRKDKEIIKIKNSIFIFTVFLFIIAPSILFFVSFSIKIKNKLIIIDFQKKELHSLHQKNTETQKKLQILNKDLDAFSDIIATDLYHSVEGLQSKLEKTVKIQQIPDPELNSLIKIKGDAGRLKDLINFLLSNAKHTKEHIVEPEEINFYDVLDQVKNSLKSLILLLEPQILYDEFPNFRGYHIQFFQLFKNMIENALKYSHPERKPVISIDILRKDKLLTIVIADNGLGIPKDKQSEIFDLFVQSREVDSSKGMGIGLNICKKIASSYNGRIEIKSEEGNGCQFIIELNEL